MIAPWGNRFRLGDAACFGPVAPVLAAVAAVTSVVGSVSSGMAQANAANYNAQVDRNNAIQAQQAADQQAVASQQQTAARLGQQKVDYAASGVDVGQGSPLDVMSDTMTKGRLDAMTLRYSGQVRGLQDTSAATLAQYQGASAQTASNINAGSTLLTGGSKLASAYGLSF